MVFHQCVHLPLVSLLVEILLFLPGNQAAIELVQEFAFSYPEA